MRLKLALWFSFLLSVNIAYASGQCVAVGEGEHAYLTHNNGTDWILSNPIILPDDLPFDEYTLSDVTCSDTGLCHATARGSDFHVFIFTSHDFGQNWSYTATLPRMTEIIEHTLSGLSCDSKGERCIITASYLPELYKTFPIIYVTHDAGKTWDYTIFPQSTENYNVFAGVHCDDMSRCLAYSITGTQYLSNDFGLNWTISQPFEDTKLDELYIQSLDCEQNRCMIVGTYNDHFAPSVIPVSLMSHDFAKTWDINNNFLLPFEPYEYYLVRLSDISCTQQLEHCTVVGEVSLDNKTTPIEYFSSNFGKSWYASVLPLQADITDAVLYGIDCAQSGACVIIGWPYLFYSGTNDRSNWLAPASTPPAAKKNQQLSVSCVN